MPQQLLTQHELETRLFRWLSSSSVPRYPFYDVKAYSAAAVTAAASTHLKSGKMQDLNRWFHDIERAAHDCDIPQEQYPDVAIYFLRGELKEVMCERREWYLQQSRRVFWLWSDFKYDLTRVVQEARLEMVEVTTEAFQIIATEARKFFAAKAESACEVPDVLMQHIRRVHPYIASSLKVGLIVGGSVIALPALGLLAWKRYYVKQNNADQAGSR
ncbi:hypothetical protein D9613_001366 [Agrocybe pediades]|uniref:Uncharacterized protein n=1 Tax=Agrocybe pediades TaxID=84607 RepID=A0A8H4VXX9_9AGAR|nr:hypothetical protein D9613_001366 [Agrocybe pediades]